MTIRDTAAHPKSIERQSMTVLLVLELSAERKKVIVPVVDEGGVVNPAGSKTVWPVYCRKKP